ncbi:MAG TPA: sigma-70 family RNA polymerase sigma factor [Planctomycetota bacterium]|nr:sigma-70 family RNA polymerase sigma factor [Planctomycetota bacterium]
MDDDFALLTRYVREHSDAAFETLMQRHLDLVYSSALRLTADPHLAEDVTQAVFIVLARKAPQLNSKTVLPAWLLSVTKLTAANARRQKNNRRRLEQETAALNQNRTSDGDWIHVAPLLDDAIDQLNDVDRAAVVLRFFKRCSVNELAAQLHLTPAAAEKRVLRALEKLRGFFSRKGVTLSGLALAALLSEHSVHAAPAALAVALPGAIAAAKGGIAITSSVSLAKGALTAMTVASTKQLALCACIFLFVGVAGGLAIKLFLFPSAPPASQAATASSVTDKQVWTETDSAERNQIPVQTEAPAETPPVIVAAPPAAPAPLNGAPPQSLQTPNLPAVNVLAFADAAADSINGSWKLEGGQLTSNNVTAFSRFEFPYVPPDEYDFKLDFTVLQPRNDVAIICAKNGRQFVWKMASHGNKVNAFEAIGNTGDANNTLREKAKVFEKNGRYEVVVQVRDRSVAAYINGNLESWHPTDYNDMGFFLFWKLAHPDTLGVGTWATPLTIHSAQIVAVRGAGHPVRAPGEQPIPREKPLLTDANQWVNAVNLIPLIDPNRDAVTGKWRVSPSGIDCEPSTNARLEIPYLPPEEYDFKIVFTRQTGTNGVHQILGINGKAVQWCMSETGQNGRGNTSAFHCLTGPNYEGNNPTSIVGARLPNNQRITSIVQVRKNRLAAFVNGALVTSWNDGFGGIRLLKEWKMPTTGLLGIGSDENATVFHSIEILEITGKGQPVAGRNKRMPEIVTVAPTPNPAPVAPPKKTKEEDAF